MPRNEINGLKLKKKKEAEDTTQKQSLTRTTTMI